MTFTSVLRPGVKSRRRSFINAAKPQTRGWWRGRSSNTTVDDDEFARLIWKRSDCHFSPPPPPPPSKVRGVRRRTRDARARRYLFRPTECLLSPLTFSCNLSLVSFSRLTFPQAVCHRQIEKPAVWDTYYQLFFFPAGISILTRSRRDTPISRAKTRDKWFRSFWGTHKYIEIIFSLRDFGLVSKMCFTPWF